MVLGLSISPDDFNKTHTTPSVTNRLTSEAGLDTMGHFIVTKDSIYTVHKAQGDHFVNYVSLLERKFDNIKKICHQLSFLMDERWHSKVKR